MTTKYNTKHPDRGRSRYGARLAARGLSKSPRLEDVDTLRDRQERREEATGYPWWSAYAVAAVVTVGEAEPNPKAEALLRDIFGARVPDDGLEWDTATHSYVFSGYDTDHTQFFGYEGQNQ